MKSRSAGFTLIELILATGLLSVVLLVTFNAITTGVQSRDAIAERARELRTVDAFIQRLERELAAAYVGVVRSPTGQAERILAATDFVGIDNEDVVPRDGLAFTCHCAEVWSFGLQDSNQVPHTEVAYDFVYDRELDYSVLMRRQDIGLDGDATSGGVSDRMWSEIRGLNLRYLDPQSRRWLESWDATDNPNTPLPQAVEVTIWLAPPTTNDENLASAYVIGHTIVLPNVEPAQGAR